MKKRKGEDVGDGEILPKKSKASGFVEGKGNNEPDDLMRAVKVLLQKDQTRLSGTSMLEAPLSFTTGTALDLLSSEIILSEVVLSICRGFGQAPGMIGWLHVNMILPSCLEHLKVICVCEK